MNRKMLSAHEKTRAGSDPSSRPGTRAVQEGSGDTIGAGDRTGQAAALGRLESSTRCAVELDFPRFVLDLIHEGAESSGSDALTYLTALVCQDALRRDEERKARTCRLPDVDPKVRERALKTIREMRAKRSGST